MKRFSDRLRSPVFAAQVALLLTLSACDGPFGIGSPSTRALEEGVVRSLDTQAGVKITGSYRERGEPWTLHLEIGPRGGRRIALTSRLGEIEAIVIGDQAYFRGERFAAEHLGTDPLARDLAKAVGSSWWRGAPGEVPELPHLTQGAPFHATFLGPAVTSRVDHVSVDGVDATLLSGPRGDVFVSAGAPHRLLRLKLNAGAAIDGVTDADLRYATDPHVEIVAPSNVVDLADRATLTPMYSVVSVDTSRCASPCVAAATLRNLGGKAAARAPSTITFTATDPVSGRTLASCRTPVAPDVGYHLTTTASCVMDALEPGRVTAIITATPENPGAP